MFDNNSFKDFTKNKMHEILDDKQFDEENNLNKQALDYGTPEDKNSHKNFQIHQSPGSLRSRKLNIEKWVDTDVNNIYKEDEDQIRSKTLKIICDQNTPKTENNDGYFASQPSVTDRVSNLIQRTKTLESNNSSDRESSLKKNTVDELLKSNSDDQFEREDLNVCVNQDSDKNLIAISDLSSPRLMQEERPEDADYLQDTLELIKEDFKKYGLSPEEDEPQEKHLNSFNIGIDIKFPSKQPDHEELLENARSDEQPEEKDIDHKNTIEQSKTLAERPLVTDVDKVEISENIADHLIKEVEKKMFPQRSIKSEDSSNNLMQKYSEKAVFHLKSIEQPDDNVQDLKEDHEESDASLDAIEDAIMVNFNLIRNFEMKRTRSEKNAYDNEIFQIYVNEVFSAIQTRSDLFLKAFSKPIQKDFLEQLNILHFYGLPEQHYENPDESMIDNLDDQASILTIDLYLSLEKKREEENERIRNLVSPDKSEVKEGIQESPVQSDDSFEFPDTKMPTGLIKGSKKVSKSHVRNKLLLFAECEHIHNKAIFDGINEALDIYRPHGKKGEPLPWTRKSAFKIDYTKTEIQSSQILRCVMNTLLDWNSFKVGPLPCQEFYKGTVFDEDKFAEFREKKL